MGITLTRKHVSNLAKLDFAGLTHAQRLDHIAAVLGYANQASMMATLKAEEQPVAAAPAAEPVTVLMAFGTGMTNALDLGFEATISDDTDGEIVEKTFATPAEANAYLEGVADMDGWMCYAVAACNTPGDTVSPEFFTARKEEPTLDFAAWHNRKVAEAELEDDDGDLDP
ncbi:hypothetical protein LAZ40_06665 [Cereibacter sphaeroides]|uniref:hypothetical protein n=1 Tax=Cereibacter sphaeroides TaxID=1063 RepID=UPI001F1B9D48|nr:hypothetical protein [Cereibacter sphaeroides]MCE6958728.1 hypothetical protein [Cereibacter sphaeroides]MCE6973398.1 hypothetical protein [Cereibacter sphaeroides]